MTALRLVEELEPEHAGAGSCSALADRYPTPELPAYKPILPDGTSPMRAAKRVYQRFGDDPDIAAIFIDSQIMLTPWAFGMLMRAPTVARVDVIIKRCQMHWREMVLIILVFCITIFTFEMSPTPEVAMVSAHRLGDLAPRDAGHLHHMPAHIHALEGDFRAATRCSHKAVASNQMFKPFLAATPFYRTSLCHDAHMLIYAGMMTGNHADAMAGVAEMQAVLEGAEAGLIHI